MSTAKHDGRRVTLILALVLLLIGGIPVHAQEARSASSDPIPFDELPPELVAVPASDAKQITLEGVVEFGYEDESGRYVVDVLEHSSAYLGLVVTTLDGRPVVGAKAEVSVAGTSRLIPGDVVSDENGIIEFQVVGRQMGADQVVAQVGETSVRFLLNVISLSSAGFPPLVDVEGGIPWSELMQAQLRYEDRMMLATFPESVQKRAGTLVKLSGFMMPLDADIKQKRFVLTSNPPSCFFHVPGGPAGAVEVLAAEGIEVSWDPVVIEGRFEPQESSDTGVAYRLLDARLVSP